MRSFSERHRHNSTLSSEDVVRRLSKVTLTLTPRVVVVQTFETNLVWFASLDQQGWNCAKIQAKGTPRRKLATRQRRAPRLIVHDAPLRSDDRVGCRSPQRGGVALPLAVQKNSNNSASDDVELGPLHKFCLFHCLHEVVDVIRCPCCLSIDLSLLIVDCGAMRSFSLNCAKTSAILSAFVAEFPSC